MLVLMICAICCSFSSLYLERQPDEAADLTLRRIPRTRCRKKSAPVTEVDAARRAGEKTSGARIDAPFTTGYRHPMQPALGPVDSNPGRCLVAGYAPKSLRNQV